MIRKSVLITDLDNTLFDWVGLWYSCFGAMLKEIAQISGISIDELKPEIRAVHRKHGTSEYSFLIEEIPSLRKKYNKSNLLEIFKPAISVYRQERRKNLHLYPTVAETLLKIKGRGALIVGYTESMAFYSNYRVRRLGLDGVFDHIFSPRDHILPIGLSLDDIRKYPASHYQFRYTTDKHTPEGSAKPDCKVLLDIVSQLGVKNEGSVYVGDSLFKDIAMAQDAGILDVWAKYGGAQHTEAYALLREVTHWSDADVEHEKKIRDRDIEPSHTLVSQFSEVLNFVEFDNVGDE